MLHVDAFKPDASWMRLQAVQTVHQLASISIQTSFEAVVRLPLLCAGPPANNALKDACENSIPCQPYLTLRLGASYRQVVKKFQVAFKHTVLRGHIMVVAFCSAFGAHSAALCTALRMW